MVRLRVNLKLGNETSISVAANLSNLHDEGGDIAKESFRQLLSDPPTAADEFGTELYLLKRRSDSMETEPKSTTKEIFYFILAISLYMLWKSTFNFFSYIINRKYT